MNTLDSLNTLIAELKEIKVKMGKVSGITSTELMHLKLLVNDFKEALSNIECITNFDASSYPVLNFEINSDDALFAICKVLNDNNFKYRVLSETLSILDDIQVSIEFHHNDEVLKLASTYITHLGGKNLEQK